MVTLLTGHMSATLPALAFEGATKRTKPTLRPGALVYARVVSCDRHAEPELSCVDPTTGKADGLGELRVSDRDVGYATIVRVHPSFAVALLRPSSSSDEGGEEEKGGHTLLPVASTFFPFEAAIGLNGIVWIRADKPQHLIALQRLLTAADGVVAQPSAGLEDLTAQQYIKRRGRIGKPQIETIIKPFL